MTKLSSKILNSIEDVIRFGNSSKVISLHEPFFENTNAWDYVKNCIDTGWVSSSGEYVKRFEEKICSYTGSKYAIVVNNGTVGLRLGLYVLGVRNNEEVLIPPFSFVATANAVSHLGAVPHFIDIDESTLSMSPNILDKRLKEIAFKKDNKVFNKKTGKRIAAIVPVHVFGIPADLEAIRRISQSWGIPVLEDAAEALGSWINVDKKKIHCGLIGDMGVISFNGNKLITTGGGGVIISNNKELSLKARHLSTTAKISHPWEYDHDEIGWNDRLPNINAALGCAQLEILDERLSKKINLVNKYKNSLKDINEISFLSPRENSISNNWLATIVFNIEDKSKAKIERDILLEKSHKKNILLRPLWKPLHKLNIYKNCPRSSLNSAEEFEHKVINLPSSPQLIE